MSEPPKPPRRGWRDPLLHYLLLGGLAFGGFRVAQSAGLLGEAETEGRETIRVGPEVVQSLAEQFEARYARPWNDEERALAIDAWVDDEILYRAGRAEGLHLEDPVARRRVIQHMRFVLETQRPVPPPTDAQLQAFLKANANRYRADMKLDYRELALAKKAFDDPELAAQSTMAELMSGASPEQLAGEHEGIQTGEAEGITLERAAAVRGPIYAQFLAAQPLDTWASLELDDRWVLVRIQAHDTSGQLPPLEKIRERLVRDWTADQQQAHLDQALDDLRKKYDVVDP